MTRPHAPAGTYAQRAGGLGPRLLAGVPVAALLALLLLIFLSWTGWGFETDPVAQALRDAPGLVLAGLAGAGAGMTIAWVVAGRRTPALAVGAFLGVLPAVLRLTAYFTSAY